MGPAKLQFLFESFLRSSGEPTNGRADIGSVGRKVWKRGKSGASIRCRPSCLRLRLSALIFTPVPITKRAIYSLKIPGKGYGFPVPMTLRELLVGDDARFF